MLIPKKVSFPRLAQVRQKFPSPRVEDPVGQLQREVRASRLAERVGSGDRIAITAGSRGICQIAELLGAVVSAVSELGGEPFIVPAMGSHGGATSEGQVELLASYGVTEERMGAPIRSSMEVVRIGALEEGVPVLIDRLASEADGIIVANRVKPHTIMKGPIESGLMKMMAIGLGKHEGATLIHSFGASGLRRMVPAAGRVILEKSRILLGIAIVENAYDQIARIEAVEPDQFEERERELLEEAKALMPRLPFDDIDLLIVEEMGKNISGTGMDTNIIGRIMLRGEAEPERPNVQRIVVLDLTDESHGNALGIGLADVITRRLVHKIDFNAVYANVITSTFLNRGNIPVTMETDRDAIAVALATLGLTEPQDTRVVRVKNTLELAEVQISENLLPEARERDDLEVVGRPEEMVFTSEGRLR